MKTIELDMYQATAVAALVLLLGRVLVAKISILRRYCIPAPVVGGFLYAIVHTIVRGMGILEISCDMTLKNVFMVAFFCSVGFTASFRMLKKGGVQTVVFLALSAVMVILQNVLGAGLASVFGLDPRLGLATGSIPMVGGHGTAGSFGPLLEELGVANASVVAIASATYGLVAGCVIGGPIATAKIRKYKLSAVTEAATKTETVETDETGAIDSARILDGLLYLIVAIGAGTIVSMFLGKFMTFPFYIGAMLVGAIIRNIMDVQNKEIPMEEISTLGGASLSVFLGLAMIDMKLWQLAELAVPMVVMLLAQTVLMFFYANFVVFNVLGKSYDAAVMTSGFCGFGMGATPNAMANMQAITGVYDCIHGSSAGRFLIHRLCKRNYPDRIHQLPGLIDANFKRSAFWQASFFCVIGNSLEFSITQKETNVPMIRTRAKMQVVASDRARRPNVPVHIRSPSSSYNQEQYNSISK